MSKRGQPRNARKISAGRAAKAASQTDKNFSILLKRHPLFVKAFVWTGVAGALILFFGPDVRSAFEEV